MTKPKAEAAKRKRGRPTKYCPDFCARVVAYGRQGKSKAQIAAKLKISRETLDIWGEEYPEFSDAIKRAQGLALAWWEDAGQTGLTGDKFNATAFIFQMKNRFREDYRDQQFSEHSGPNGRGLFADLNLQNLSDAEFSRLKEILAAGGAAVQGPT